MTDTKPPAPKRVYERAELVTSTRTANGLDYTTYSVQAVRVGTEAMGRIALFSEALSIGAASALHLELAQTLVMKINGVTKEQPNVDPDPAT